MSIPSHRNRLCIFTLLLIGSTIITIFILLEYIQQKNETWHGIAENFAFPFIYSIFGILIAGVIGDAIATSVLDHYNSRLASGLTQRTIQLIGAPSLTSKLHEDIKKSALIKSKVITSTMSVSSESDLVVLSLDLDWYSGLRPQDGPTADKLVKGESELTRVINELTESQALIVLTLGTLDRTADVTKTFFERRFSTIVNAQGRILSDIHSLLTTLPPRNRE